MPVETRDPAAACDAPPRRVLRWMMCCAAWLLVMLTLAGDASAQLSPEEALRRMREKDRAEVSYDPEKLDEEIEDIRKEQERNRRGGLGSSSVTIIVPPRAVWEGFSFLVLGDFDLDMDRKADDTERLIRLIKLGGGKVVDRYSPGVSYVLISDRREDGTRFGNDGEVNLTAAFGKAMNSSAPSIAAAKRFVTANKDRWLPHSDTLKLMTLDTTASISQEMALRKLSNRLTWTRLARPFEKHVEEMVRKAEVNVYVDWGALAEAGVKPTTSVASPLGSGSAFALMSAMTRRAAPGKATVGLDPFGVLVVTTKDGLKQAAGQPFITEKDFSNSDQQTAARRLGLSVSVDLKATPLEKALKQIADGALLTIKVDWGKLAAAGVRPTTPLTLTLKQVPAQRLFSLALHRASGQDLQFGVDSNGNILVPGQVSVVRRQPPPTGGDTGTENPATATGPSAPVSGTPEERIAAKVSLGSQTMTLRQALLAWSKTVQLKVEVDWKIVEEAGIYRRCHVTPPDEAKSAKDLLTAILEQAADGASDKPAFRIDTGRETVTISTASRLR